MLGPKNRPTSYHDLETSRPTAGMTARVYSHHSGSHGRKGTWNSRLAMVPPGFTTLASSESVAAGSSTYRRRYVKVSASKVRSAKGRRSPCPSTNDVLGAK